ncbi:MAG: hypothetical protein CL780_00955 [Chloroflexi bacterium]|nr:hypothetical protein [Chloroflexota bacterium]|tara:strand:+ start:1042 stop:1671 length:630 start_codon:yes stop_codon:yes gene_type:complete
MSLQEKINELKEELSGKNLPGTSRKLVNTTKISTLLDEISELLPSEIKEAEIVIRQKSAILDQAEEESKKIRSYADEEGSTIIKTAKAEKDKIIASAKSESEKLVSEKQIVSEATNKSENILSNAKQDSEKILEEAKSRSETLIADTEEKINSMLSKTEEEVEQRRTGADNYAREVLFALEERVSDTLSQVRGGIDMLDKNDSGIKDTN